MLEISENQDIEFKESWRDEYIKWICGFANAKGGKIYIGVDDSGKIVGVKNAKKLLEDIPNKVRDILGIIIDISMKKEDLKEYLEIVVEPYSYPINYKGQYHYRSGSTKQELKGQALNSFLLKSYGKHWDGVEVPNVSMDDLDKDTFSIFIQNAIKSKRIDEDKLPQNFDELLDKLRLIENGFIKRAGVLLFAKDPQKYVSGAFIKIAFFENSADIVYQNVIEGNLFSQVQQVFDLLFTKYLKAHISYEGIQRVEQFDYDSSSLREIIHNAIVHKDYSSGVPIQIGVFKDKMFIYNTGQLPQNWTIKTITSKHRSVPFNPDIANAFFKAGLIESWGRGIEKVIESSKKYNGVMPSFEWINGLNVEFKSKYPNQESSPKSSPKSSSKTEDKIIDFIKTDSTITTQQIAQNIGITKRAVLKQIKKLKDDGVIERVGSARSGYWDIKV